MRAQYSRLCAALAIGLLALSFPMATARRTRRTRRAMSTSTHLLQESKAIDKNFGGVATLTPVGDHTASVIFMHGLGVRRGMGGNAGETAPSRRTPTSSTQDTNAGWIGSIQHMVAPALPHVRFVLPTAGKLPVGGKRTLRYNCLPATSPRPASGHHQRRHAHAGMV